MYFLMNNILSIYEIKKTILYSFAFFLRFENNVIQFSYYFNYGPCQ